MKRLVVIASLLFGIGLHGAALPSQQSIMLIIDDDETSDLPRAMKQSFKASLEQNEAPVFVSRYLVKSTFEMKKNFKGLQSDVSLTEIFELPREWLENLIFEIMNKISELNSVNNESTNHLFDQLRKPSKDRDSDFEEKQQEFKIRIAALKEEIKNLEEKKVRFTSQEQALKLKNMGKFNREFFEQFHFDFSQWYVFEVRGDYLFVPRSKQDLLTDRGILKPIENEDLLYKSLSGEVDGLSHLNNIYDVFKALSNDASVWNVYLTGHGLPSDNINTGWFGFSSGSAKDSHIAGFSLEEFNQLLSLFLTKLNIKFLYYETCYGGGENAAQIAKYLNKIAPKRGLVSKMLSSKELKRFPIVTATVLDVSINREKQVGRQLEDYFETINKIEVMDKESVIKAIALLHPSVNQCPKDYNPTSITRFFPGMLLPDSSSFVPVTTCSSLLILTKDNVSSKTPLNIDNDIRGILVDASTVSRKIEFKGNKIPPVFMAKSGKSKISFNNLSVPRQTGVSFTDFIEKAFFHIQVHYEKEYYIKKLSCWFSPRDKNYEAVKYLLNEEGEIELSDIVLQRSISLGGGESIGMQFRTSDGKAFFISGVGKDKVFSELPSIEVFSQ